MSAQATVDVPTYPGFGPARWIDVDGIRTWYADQGSGPTIVLVYGGNAGPPTSGGGVCAMVWSETFQRLSRFARVIVYDRPGNGYSSAPERDEDFTMAFNVAHLIGFLEALELEPVHLIGHSRGGFLTTRATLLRQDLVRSLTIVTSGTLGPGVPMNAVALSGNPHSPYGMEGMLWVHERYSYGTEHVTEEWMAPFVDHMADEPYRRMLERITRQRLLERFFRPGLAADKRETLRWLEEGRLQRPTQIVWGRTDRTVPVKLGFDLFDIVAGKGTPVTLSVVDKSGHFPYREHPQWFDDTVRDFVAEVEKDA